MLQRPQSIFLALVIMALFFATTTTVWSEEPGTYLSVWKLQSSTDGLLVVVRLPYVLLGTLCYSVMGLAGYSLCSYSNRQLQLRLGTYNSIFIIFMIVFVIYFVVQRNLQGPLAHYQNGFLALVVALVSNLLASYFIRKDEALVRSADRIR